MARVSRRIEGMRSYWDNAAHENAAWYVDTTLNFDSPDMDEFLETGERIVAEALDGAPAVPAGKQHAVEIGCGLGRICRALAARFDRVTGVDISTEMVRQARELVPDDTVQFVVTDGASIPGVADGDADLVLTFTVFQHIPDVSVIETYVAEAGRVLRSGGVFVFQWNNSPGALRWSLRRSVLALLQRTGLRRERYGRNAAEFLGSIVPVDRMRRALDSAGLDLVDTKGEGTLFCWAWARKR
jgi:SAM-dependent methyltransferase